MSILTNFVNTSGNLLKRHSFNLKAVTQTIQRYSEIFWFCTAFVLFLLMGPFSVIAVVPALFSLSSEKHRRNMREPAKC